MDYALRRAQEDCTESYLVTEGLQLERELNAAKDRIKRLEEAGDKMEAWLRDERLDAVQHTVSKWRKAKEAKL
jgi:hypothetical protein